MFKDARGERVTVLFLQPGKQIVANSDRIRAKYLICFGLLVECSRDKGQRAMAFGADVAYDRGGNASAFLLIQMERGFSYGDGVAGAKKGWQIGK